MPSTAADLAPSGDTPPGTAIPFDAAHLDELLDAAGIDVLIASSKHNIQYLLGGYRFFFFDYSDAIGISRYLPLFLYFKGRPELSSYIGNSMESWEDELGSFWTPHTETAMWSSCDAMEAAVQRLRSAGVKPRRIAVERSFLPADAEALLRERLPDAEVTDAHLPLERLRACKSPRELDLLREASVRVVDSMLAVFAACGPGTSKRDLAEALRREEVGRGLIFEYCLIAAGTSHNRSPSEQVWREGEVLSLDSGGNYQGYIGDLCRMGIAGEPDAELEDLLGHIDAVQQAARRPIRAGRTGAEIYAATAELLRSSPHRAYLNFVAHGMGLISHEAPRLTDRQSYKGDDALLPLQAGMVLSIETTMLHPRRGFIKLEDTVAVTDGGHEAFGDYGRGWNVARP